MSTISQYPEVDHHYCDAQFDLAETCVSKGDWLMARTAFDKFDTALQRYPDMEEKILFPAFEQTPGTPTGPTSMMSSEHQHLREIIKSMTESLLSCNADEFSSCANMLHIMMGQHNMKKESLLYPMADGVLTGRTEEFISEMRERHHLSGAHE